MMMISTFLPLAYNNIHRFLLHYVWAIIWGLSLLVFYSKIFYSRTMVYIFTYGLIIFLATNTIWSSIDDWNYELLIREIYPIATGVSVITYFLHSKDYIGLAKITRWIIVFIFITAIMTIISSAIDPMYTRNMIGLSAASSESEREALLSIRRYGGGGYGTAAAFMCLFPIFIYYYKNIKMSLIQKNIIIIISIIIFYALLGMQVFGNILIAIGFSIFALLGTKKIKQSILAICLFFSIMLIIPKDIYVNRLLFVSDYFEKYSDINNKIRDLAIYIETGGNIEDNSTMVGGRVERYPMLMKTFLKSPLLGCYFFSDKTANGYRGSGAHLYWMNKLTVTGIIGLILFLIIPYCFIRNNLRLFDSTYKYYYILASLSILSYGLMKNLIGRETWYAFFIILPGLYYLPLLKSKQ
jgi:hypothetical protein